MTRVFGAHRSASRLYWLIPVVLGLAFFGFALVLAIHPDEPGVPQELWLATATFAVAAATLYWFIRYRVVIGEDGIRIRRAASSIELGRPRKLRCGQYEQDIVIRGSLTDMHIPITRVWLVVEGATGAKVLFIGSRGATRAPLDWPMAQPPQAHHVLYGDVVALRDAIGERITAG